MQTFNTVEEFSALYNENNPWAVFHGTNTAYQQRIEAEGWIAERHPCDEYDLRFLATINKSISNVPNMVTLNYKKLARGNNYGGMHVTPKIDAAIHYARNFDGGETIKNLIEVCDDFIGQELRFTSIAIEKIKNIRRKYVGQTLNCRPVVYSIQVRPEQFSEETLSRFEYRRKRMEEIDFCKDHGGPIPFDIEYLIKKTITPDQIVGKFYPSTREEFEAELEEEKRQLMLEADEASD